MNVSSPRARSMADALCTYSALTCIIHRRGPCAARLRWRAWEDLDATSATTCRVRAAPRELSAAYVERARQHAWKPARACPPANPGSSFGRSRCARSPPAKVHRDVRAERVPRCLRRRHSALACTRARRRVPGPAPPRCARTRPALRGASGGPHVARPSVPRPLAPAPPSSARRVGRPCHA
ncbi:hypothetical protein PsYK624_007230 [Phanerochaete sordida]|uniref:Uncharacterized protein n=1 Tax=Phanerochaete sordida TaxID=48140 RepID=A0A9P3FY59_9APHY|nr:hypothetical protein PsYK624_007230 [Phanerochaete sordida]